MRISKREPGGASHGAKALQKVALKKTFSNNSKKILKRKFSTLARESVRKRSLMNLHAAPTTMGVSTVDDRRRGLSSMFTWFRVSWLRPPRTKVAKDEHRTCHKVVQRKSESIYVSDRRSRFQQKPPPHQLSSNHAMQQFRIMENKKAVLAARARETQVVFERCARILN